MQRHGRRLISTRARFILPRLEELERRDLLSISPTDPTSTSRPTLDVIDQYGDALFGAKWQSDLGMTVEEVKSAIDDGSWRDILVKRQDNDFISEFRSLAQGAGSSVTQSWFDAKLGEAGLKTLNVAHFDWFEQVEAISADSLASGPIVQPLVAAYGLIVYDSVVDTSSATSANVTVHFNVADDDEYRAFLVDYYTSNGSAVAGVDYQSKSGTFSFSDSAEGEQRSITIPIFSNGIDNNGKSFYVNLTSVRDTVPPSDSNEDLPTIGDGLGIVTIIDPDETQDLPRVSISNSSGTEGEYLNFTASLDRAISSNVTVSYKTIPGSASTSDYSHTQGTLTFTPSQTTRLVSVPTHLDGILESSENFTVKLFNPIEAVVGDDTGLGTIVDSPIPKLSISDAQAEEGNPLQFTASLSFASSSTVTVSYKTKEGTATNDDFVPKSSGTVTFSPGVVSQVVSVASMDDALPEANEYFYVDLFDPVGAFIGDGSGKGTISDNEPLPRISINPTATVNEGGWSFVAVYVYGVNGQPITVNYSTQSGTATFGDYASSTDTLFIPAGAFGQAFIITAFTDNYDEVNEIYYINLSNPVNATILNGQSTVTIVDQTPTPTPPKVSISDGQTVEGDTHGEYSIVFNVSLSESTTDQVTVQYQTSNETANNISDYHATSGTLTFAPGTTASSAAVSIIGDLNAEQTETFRVTLSAAVNAEIDDGVGRGTIYDDDTLSDDDEDEDDCEDDDDCECECGGDPGSAPNASASNFSGESTTTAGLAGGSLPVGAVNSSATMAQPIVGLDPVAPTSVSSSTKKIYSATAQLTLNGVTGPPTYYNSTGGFDQGETLRIALQADATSLSTGTYPWSMSITYLLTEPGGGSPESITREYHGQKSIVNRVNSPYGAGWWINGLESLSIQGNNVTHVSGGGKSTHYAYDSDNVRYVGPEYIRGITLAHDVVSGDYELHTGTKIKTFNASGKLVSVADRYGNVTQYSYNPDGSLDKITDPLARKVQFGYLNGKLSSVTDVDGRVATVAMNVDGAIGSITAENSDPGGTPLVNLFAYNSAKQMTQVTATTGEVTTIQRNAASGRVESVWRGAEMPYSFAALHTYGLAIPSTGVGTLLNPATLKGANRVVTVVNENQDTAYYTFNGLGLVTSYTDFNGYTTEYQRNDGYRVSYEIRPDPDGAGSRTPMHIRYIYENGTNDVRSRYTLTLNDGGALEQTIYDYSSGFRELIFQRDTRSQGLVGTHYEYDPVTRELISERVRIGQLDGQFNNNETDDLVTTYTYVSAGSGLPIGTISTITDPMGNITKYEYFDVLSNPNFGRLKKVIQAFNSVDETTTEYDYDPVNHTETVIDGRDNATVSYYNGLRQLVRVVQPDPDGPTGPLDELEWLYTYDDGLLVITTDPMGNVTTNAYDVDGRLHQVTMPAPAPGQQAPYTIYSYDSLGNVEEINESGRITQYKYDPNGNRTRMILPNPNPSDPNSTSPEWTYVYDAVNLMTSATDPLNHTTNYEYDSLMRQTKVISPAADGGTTNRPTTINTYVYDQIEATTDPMGNVTTYIYDDAGRMIEMTTPDPDGPTGPLVALVWAYAYDKNGNRVSQTDPLGRTTTWTYDALNRTKTILPPAPAAGAEQPLTTYAYDANGNLIELTDPLGQVTNYEYDALNRPVKTIQPAPTTGTSRPETVFAYDDNGNRVSVTDPLGRTTNYQYDAVNRLVKMIEPAATVGGSRPETTYGWDVHGNQVAVTDALGQTTDYAYDGLSRLEKTIQPAPTTGASRPETSYVYDAANNRTSLTDPNANTTSWVYDQLDRVEKVIDPLLNETLFEYDLNGRVTKKTDRKGRVTQYTYDPYGRMTSEEWLEGAQVVRTLSFAFDQVGNLARTEDDATSQVIEYFYDNLDRPATEQNTLSELADPLLSYQAYDVAGRRTQIAVFLGQLSQLVNDYAYDNLGRLLKVSQSNAPLSDLTAKVVPKRVEFAYNAAGQITALDRYNEFDSLQVDPGLIAGTTYTYDLAGWLTDMDHTPAVGSPITQGWTYDAARRVTSYANSVDGTINYDYDNTNQLTEAGTHDYVYDPAGNPLQRDGVAYDAAAGNRLESDDVYDYTYDDEGNMVTKSLIAGGEDWTYSWDHRNRLTSIVYDGPGTSGDYTLSFTYDVFNRRTSRSLDADVTDFSEVYIYDGADVVLDFVDDDGPEGPNSFDVVRKYLYGPAVDQLLAMEDITEPIYTPDRVTWFLHDQQNTTRDLLDNTGDLVSHYEYDPFGLPTAGDLDHTRYLYTGREFEVLVGLQYNRNRWYDPAVGRWLSEDPIGFAASDANLYRYVSNSPTNFTDPSGLVVGVGQLHYTKHAITFSIRKGQESRANLEANLRIELANFSYFNGGLNDIAAVRVSSGVAYFDLLGFSGWASDWLAWNDDEVAVKITATDNEVTGQTMFRHQLVGTRKWRFGIEEQECYYIVTVETEAYERTRTYANWLGSTLTGETAQLAIWTAYLNNVFGYYSRTFNARTVQPATGESRWLGDMESPW